MYVIFKPVEAQLTHDTDPTGKMDPYFKIEVNGQVFISDVCKEGGKNPKWDDTFSFPLGGDGSIKVSLWDKDNISSDDLIGDSVLNLFQLGSLVNAVEWFDIYYKGEVAGKIAAQVTRVQPNSGPHVIIRPVRGELIRDNDTFGKMDVFVEILSNGQEHQSSVCYKGGKTPVWNDSLVLPLNGDGAIRVVLYDKDGSKNDLIGDANSNLYQLLQQSQQMGGMVAVEIAYKGKSAGKVFFQVTSYGK